MSTAFDMNTATLSTDGFEMVDFFEGWETKELDAAGDWTGYYISYKKGVDPWTIGPGLTGRFRATGKRITEGTRASHQECVDEMQLRLHNEVYPLVREFFAPKTQGEFDAATSFVWNTNQDSLRKSYTLPSLVLAAVRLADGPIGQAARDAIVRKWVIYKNPETPFEQGLYRRRLAELCMFFGLPWKFATSAVLKRSDPPRYITGAIKEQTDPFYVLDLAREAAEKAAEKERQETAALNRAQEEKLRKAAPKAAPKPKPEPAPKPPSPKTVQPAEVPYRIDPNAGLKPLEESDRAKGFVWQQISIFILRITSLGTFGTGAKAVADTVQSDAALSGAVLNLTIPVLVLATGLVTAFVLKQYGDWKRDRGQKAATQGLY